MNYKKLLLGAITLSMLSINGCTAKKEIQFKINGKIKQEYSKTIDYHEDITYSPKDIKLTAEKNGKDITDKITYKKIKINKLKTYKIIYTVEDETFIYKMKVQDQSKPVISYDDITIPYNSSFDYSMLNVKVIDNYDKNLNDKIKYKGKVDTSIPGTYLVMIQVEDSSGNQESVNASITVSDKENIPVENKNNNTVNNPDSIQVLVNKTHRLPEDWVPNDLVSLENGHMLRSEAANSYLNMVQAAAQDGITINLISSYRTKEYQANLYNNYFATDPVNAALYSAKPRTSEHELGLAVDISYDYNLHDDLESSEIGIWMANNAHKYGWIMRYPYGKSDITGYIYEAWHYRYVGKELATKLKNSNITLEEYYN